MRPPIIINDSSDAAIPGDVTIHATVDDAELSLECFDADDVRISAFDADGARLSILPNGNGARLAMASEQGADVRVLEELLRAIIKRAGGVIAADVSIEALIEMAQSNLSARR